MLAKGKCVPNELKDINGDLLDVWGWLQTRVKLLLNQIDKGDTRCI